MEIAVPGYIDGICRVNIKDVLMGILERDLLGMTVAFLQTAGYRFSVV